MLATAVSTTTVSSFPDAGEVSWRGWWCPSGEVEVRGVVGEDS